MLLKEMDYVPLAIQLLAQVSIGFSPLYVLKRWREEATAMLYIHEIKPNKLESVKVSISVSLAALDITNNLEVVQLLGVLWQLPDGLCQWEEQLSLVGAGFLNVYHSMYLLHKAALILIAGDRLKVLAPIRHFIMHYHPPDPHHVQCLENYFWALVHKHATTPLGPSSMHAKEILEADMGNICSSVINAVRNHPSTHVVDTVLEISQFLYFTHPSTELLYEVIPLAKRLGIPIQGAQVFYGLGNILCMQSKYTEASVAFMEAQRQFLEISNVHGEALCSHKFG